MGFWERARQKPAQRAQIPILVGDLRAAQQAVATAQGALEAHTLRVKGKAKVSAADRKKETALTERLEHALRTASDAVELVEVQAMPPAEHEALVSAHTSPTGEPNLQTLLPPLMAASCVDPDLQDADKWDELLSRPVWTSGEIDELRLRVLGLNQVSPGRLGKG